MKFETTFQIYHYWRSKCAIKEEILNCFSCHKIHGGYTQKEYRSRRWAGRCKS